MLRGAPGAGPRERRRQRGGLRHGADRQGLLRPGRAARGRAAPRRDRAGRAHGAVRGPDGRRDQEVVPQLRARRQRVRSVTMNGDVATVDLGVGFLKGHADRHDARPARPGRQHRDRGARRHARCVLLINGGTPLGLFPGVDATVPLDAGGARDAERPGHGAGDAHRAARRRRARARSSSSSPRSATCSRPGSTARRGRATQTAVIAFQKWQGLPRTGISRRAHAHGTRHRAAADRRSGRAPPGVASRC